jgi:hypothetical protein
MRFDYPHPTHLNLSGVFHCLFKRGCQGGNAALLPALKVKKFHFSSQSEAV